MYYSFPVSSHPVDQKVGICPSYSGHYMCTPQILLDKLLYMYYYLHAGLRINQRYNPLC